MLNLKFIDGTVKKFEKNTTGLDVAKSISTSLAKKCVAYKLDDVIYDLNSQINSDGNFVLLTTEDTKELFTVLNHSTAHIMALAVKRLFPNAKFSVGPAIDTGFYYDIDLDDIINEQTLLKLEKEMMRINAQALDFTCEAKSYDEIKKLFAHDEYKLELIEKINARGENFTIYTVGEFVDLCRGTHIDNTKRVKNFKLLSVAGAYHLGDSNNKMLQRIYGTSFFTKEDLASHLYILEEAKKRDHRKLGKELELFMMSEYGPGLPFFLPKGMVVKQELMNFWNEIHEQHNYEMIQSPMMLNKELWEVSGHWFNYHENMYLSEIDNKQFAIKPMNCPGSLLVYKNKNHSYKDLPIRMGELGHVHRHEASGALHGLFRVRSFTQDDAHIYMSEEQITSEVIEVIKLYKQVYEQFGLDFYIDLSTRPEKSIGEPHVWEIAEKALADACKAAGFEFNLNEGDGAFYGPKLDFKLKDSINRVWQCGTIQLDINLPERFDINYTAEDGSLKRPYMLHRACFGSIERFIGILIEHYAGAFPTWLAPVQVKILPINNLVHKDGVNYIYNILKNNKIRVEKDMRDEKLNKKIRESQVSKTPYTIIVGDSEIENNQITYRLYSEQDSITVSIDEFLKLISTQISLRK